MRKFYLNRKVIHNKNFFYLSWRLGNSKLKLLCIYGNASSATELDRLIDPLRLLHIAMIQTKTFTNYKNRRKKIAETKCVVDSGTVRICISRSR